MNVQGRNRGWVLPDMHHRSLEDHAHLGKLIDHESTGFRYHPEELSLYNSFVSSSTVFLCVLHAAPYQPI